MVTTNVGNIKLYINQPRKAADVTKGVTPFCWRRHEVRTSGEAKRKSWENREIYNFHNFLPPTLQLSQLLPSNLQLSRLFRQTWEEAPHPPHKIAPGFDL